METVYLVYKTDTHHSYSSRNIIGIATDIYEALSICTLQAHKEGEKIGIEQGYNLMNIQQTQGYTGEGEFQFEELNINVLL